MQSKNRSLRFPLNNDQELLPYSNFGLKGFKDDKDEGCLFYIVDQMSRFLKEDPSIKLKEDRLSKKYASKIVTTPFDGHGSGILCKVIQDKNNSDQYKYDIIGHQITFRLIADTFPLSKMEHKSRISFTVNPWLEVKNTVLEKNKPKDFSNEQMKFILWGEQCKLIDNLMTKLVEDYNKVLLNIGVNTINYKPIVNENGNIIIVLKIAKESTDPNDKNAKYVVTDKFKFEKYVDNSKIMTDDMVFIFHKEIPINGEMVSIKIDPKKEALDIDPEKMKANNIHNELGKGSILNGYVQFTWTFDAAKKNLAIKPTLCGKILGIIAKPPASQNPEDSYWESYYSQYNEETNNYMDEISEEEQ